jgi:hypothetical protein
MHGTERGQRVCAWARTRARGRAWRSERDDLSEFTYVPRHLVLVSLSSESCIECELERGLANHKWVDLYAQCYCAAVGARAAWV